MTDQQFYRYNSPEMVLLFCTDRFKEAETELQKADANIRVKFEEHNKAQDNMDNILDQMKEKSKIASLPSATMKDIEVSSATFDEYSAASAYCTEVYGNYKAALKTRVDAYKKFRKARDNMIVVKRRVRGEATDSDASESDTTNSGAL